MEQIMCCSRKGDLIFDCDWLWDNKEWYGALSLIDYFHFGDITINVWYPRVFHEIVIKECFRNFSNQELMLQICNDYDATMLLAKFFHDLLILIDF